MILPLLQRKIFQEHNFCHLFHPDDEIHWPLLGALYQEPAYCHLTPAMIGVNLSLQSNIFTFDFLADNSIIRRMIT